MANLNLVADRPTDLKSHFLFFAFPKFVLSHKPRGAKKNGQKAHTSARVGHWLDLIKNQPVGWERVILGVILEDAVNEVYRSTTT